MSAGFVNCYTDFVQSGFFAEGRCATPPLHTRALARREWLFAAQMIVTGTFVRANNNSPFCQDFILRCIHSLSLYHEYEQIAFSLVFSLCCINKFRKSN
jgi:hypothetical protein